MATGDACSQPLSQTEFNHNSYDSNNGHTSELSSINVEITSADLIVQNQLRDVIKIQTTTIEQLYQNVTSQETFIKENLMLREEHASKLKELEDSFQGKFVPKEEYDNILQQFENEQHSHAQTKLKLMEAVDRLDFTLGEVEVLRHQMGKEKEAFQQILDSLRNQIAKGNNWNGELESKYAVCQKRCQELEGRLASREATITTLEMQLAAQQKQCERKIEEIEVERQQDHYVARMLEQSTNGRSRNTATSKPNSSRKLKQ